VSPFRLSFPPPLGVFSQLPTTHCSLSTLFQLSPSCPERSRGVSTAFLPRAKPRGYAESPVSPFVVAFTPNRSLTPLSTAFTQSHRVWGCLCANSALSATLYPELRGERYPLLSILPPFVFILLRIAFPATSFVSQPSALPLGVTLCALCASTSVPSVLRFSFVTLLHALCALFLAPSLCFQWFAGSFAKTPGVWGASTESKPRLASHNIRPSGLQSRAAAPTWRRLYDSPWSFDA
jgi:hypothetical protein